LSVLSELLVVPPLRATLRAPWQKLAADRADGLTRSYLINNYLGNAEGLGSTRG
jgi:hypothetical protein